MHRCQADGWKNYENHPGHVGYPKVADSTPGILRRFTRSASGFCELATQMPMRSLRARSLRSLVSITTTRLPERAIRWMPVDCFDDAGVFTGHGEVTLRYLLAGPAWAWMTATGDPFMQLVGYRFESEEFVGGVAGVHCGVGSVEWLCKRYLECVLVRDRSRAVARL